MAKLRYIGQPKYRNATPAEPIGYELLLREYRETDWYLPLDFDAFSASELARLLTQTLAALPQDLPLISFNLSQRQFVDPSFRRALAAIQTRRRMNLYVELTETDEHVSLDALRTAAAAFAQLNVRVVMDDVGNGANQPDLVAALRPYTSEYKFALQNFRGVTDAAAIRSQLAFWRKQADTDQKLFAIEGFEDEADLDLIKAFQPNVMQGYYYGKPALMAVAE